MSVVIPDPLPEAHEDMFLLTMRIAFDPCTVTLAPSGDDAYMFSVINSTGDCMGLVVTKEFVENPLMWDGFRSAMESSMAYRWMNPSST